MHSILSNLWLLAEVIAKTLLMTGIGEGILFVYVAEMLVKADRGRVMPKTLFSRWMWNVAEPFIDSEEEMEELAEKGEAVFVGEYRLVKVHKVELKLKVG